MRTIILIMAMTLSAAAGETPVTGLRFGGPVNAGGHVIYNLGAGFAASNGLASSIAPGTWRNPEWFQIEWSVNPTCRADSISYRTNLDQVIQRQGFNNAKYDRVAQISEQHSFFDLAFSVTPTNLASVSSNGYLSALGDGVVTAIVSAPTFARTNALILRTEGSAIDRYWGAIPGSLRSAILSNVVASVTNATMQVFSFNDGTNFVRSTNLWLKPAPQCVAAWSSRGSLIGAALITPRHAIAANHGGYRPYVGDTLKWIDQTNGVWAATVIGQKNVADDILLVRLDADIPVPVAKFVADPAGTLPTGIADIPLALGEVHSGQHQLQLVVGGQYAFTDLKLNWRATDRAVWTNLCFHYPVTGDSSQPVLFSTGYDFVLLFCLYSAGSGPNLQYYLPAIQSGITSFGDTNAISYLTVTNYLEF